MKKILTILLVVFAFSAYSQTTIDYVYKRQPIKFSKIALADTMFLSSESPYGTYGNLFVIDSTSDGRYFINDGYAANDSLTQIRSEISDTATQIRGDISDTATQIRVELTDSTAQLRLDISDSLAINISDTATQIRTELTDSIAQLRLDISDTATQIRSELSGSTYFQLMGGKYLAIDSIGYDSLVIGGSSKDPNAVLQVNGQFNQSFNVISLTTDSIYNARNGNIVMLNNDGNLSKITNCAIGTIITFTCLPLVTSAILNPANFTANGQVLRTPSGLMKVFDAYDVFTIICVAPAEFLLHSESENN